MRKWEFVVEMLHCLNNIFKWVVGFGGRTPGTHLDLYVSLEVKKMWKGLCMNNDDAKNQSH